MFYVSTDKIGHFTERALHQGFDLHVSPSQAVEGVVLVDSERHRGSLFNLAVDLAVMPTNGPRWPGDLEGLCRV